MISLLLPLRYDLVRLGGSWAQRQVFHSTLLHAAIKCNKLPLALALVAELKVCIQCYSKCTLATCTHTQAIKPKSHRLEELFEQLKASFDELHKEESPLSLPDARRAEVET